MYQADVAQIAFPVLCLSEDNSVCAFSSLGALSRCNATSLFHNHYYDGLLIFDANGSCFAVAGADLVAHQSKLARLIARLVNKHFVVQLRISRSPTLSFAEIKAMVLEWVHRTPDYWEASRDIGDWETSISDASSVPDLVALFA